MKNVMPGWIVVMLLLPAWAWAQDATTAGAVTTPYPTLINLSVEWAISGDADDAIEADFTMGNCRVLRNRISNSFMGISSQPGPPHYGPRTQDDVPPAAPTGLAVQPLP